MTNLENLRNRLPDAAKDIKLNVQSVFQTTTLTLTQIWGVAVASAIATRDTEVRQAVIAEAQTQLTQESLQDAKAASALMAMNNVYYRFRHMIEKESYSTKPARLRMNWIGKPLANKVDFELYCLAVSAINGCEMCIRSHEDVVIKGGLSEDQVHDAIRVAATIQALAVSLEIGNDEMLGLQAAA